MRPVAYGILFGTIACVAMLMLLSVILSIVDVPQMLIEPLALLSACVGAFISGLVCSRMSREKGFFLGLVCGAVLFLIMLLCNIPGSQGVGLMAVIKLLSMLISAGVGGVAGVNAPRRRR